MVTSSGNPKGEGGRIAISSVYSAKNTESNLPSIHIRRTTSLRVHGVVVAVRSPDTVARFLSLRPLEGSSLGRGRPLSIERSLVESAQDPLDASPRVSCIHWAASLFSEVFSTNLLTSRMSPTRSAERGVLSSVTLDFAKRRVAGLHCTVGFPGTCVHWWPSRRCACLRGKNGSCA